MSMSTCELGVVRSKEPLESRGEGVAGTTACVGDEEGVVGLAGGFGG